MSVLTAPAELLRGRGLRVTVIRTAVLDVLAAHPHLDAEEVRAQVVGRLGSASVQSVYDTLNTLTEHGLLRRLVPSGHAARYELQLHDNHHHMACRRCGRVVDVPCASGHRPCLEPAEHHGFVLDEAEVVYWGLCPECAG